MSRYTHRCSVSLRSWMVAALAWASVSCGTHATTLPDDPARTGLPTSYSLQSINGSQLPFPIARRPDRVDEITGSVLTLRTDGQYDASIAVRRRLSTGLMDDTMYTSAGRYQRVGNDLILRGPNIASRTFKLTNDDMALRGPGLPSSVPAVDILGEFVFHR